MKTCLRHLLAVLSAILVLTLPAAAKRVALVIGNGAYENVERLRNPANDARDLAKKLKSIGFAQVDLHLDLDASALRRTLGKFAKTAAGAEVALVYFAGHGIEVGGNNYVIPTDAKLSHADDVEFEAVPLSSVLYALNRASKLKLVILDACRDNPFRNSMQKSGATRSVGRGLALVKPAGGHTLVAYAAKEGTLAIDGAGNNSPYAAALVKHIATPELDVRLLFGRVRDDVIKATGGKQEPFIYGSLPGKRLFLTSQPSQTATTSQPSPPRPTNQTDDTALAVELAYWNAIKESTDPAAIRSYIDKYPDGQFIVLAKLKLKRTLGEGAPAKEETQVAALPPQPAATEPVPAVPDLRPVTLGIQKQLARLNCRPGAIDGDWGPRSRNALTKLFRATKTKPVTSGPTPELLKQLTGMTGSGCAELKVASVDSRPTEEDGPWRCVSLRVRSAKLDRKGQTWDSSIRSGAQPDIRIYEKASGFTSRDCDNTYTCNVRFKPRGKSLRLRVVDVDSFKNDELIGAGTCALREGTCRVGLARVSVKRCK